MKRYINSFILFLLIFSFSTIVYSQDVAELKKRRLKALQEIEETNNLLTKKGASKKNLLSNLELLNTQIDARQKSISNMELEVSLLDNALGQNETKLKLITNKLDIAKGYYKSLIIHSYFRQSKYDDIMFILSSETISMAYKRYQILKEFRSLVKRQGDKLLELQTLQYLLNDSIKLHIEQKNDVLGSLESSAHRLAAEKHKKSSLVVNLEKEEVWLKSELAKKEMQAKALDNQIQEIIRAELAKQSKGNKSYPPSDFGKAKGLLDWPVSAGTVVSYFGQHDHAVLKSIKVNNNGIDIQASKGSSVKTVFTGTVSKVIAIPGYNMAVIIRHGNYLSVYANLGEVTVISGSAVSTGAIIGTLLSTGDEDTSNLHFEIWRESEKIDPITWLKKK